MIDRQAALFRGILGNGRVQVLQEEARVCAPHPVPLLPLVRLVPGRRDELVEVVKAAARERIGLVPVGGNTSPRVPRPGTPPACLLSTEELDDVVEHAVEDLTLTVGAGRTLASVQQIVGAHGQVLPLSGPRPDRSTVGGVVARGAEGPTRHAWGLVRDQVLGLEVVHGDGRLTKAGGRVVKNVTGYDLCRLYVGARGTLGIILEATFRLRSRPGAGCSLLARYAGTTAALGAALSLRGELPDLFALHVLGGAALENLPGKGAAALVATASGEVDLVEALKETFLARHRSALSCHVVEGTGWLPVLQDPVPEGEAWLRIVVLPGRLEALLETLAPLLARDPRLVLDVACGTLHLGFAGGWPLTADMETALGASLRPLEALVDLPRDPAFHLRRFGHFPSTVPEGIGIMQALQRALDPAGILNPGRFEVSP